MSTYDEIFGPAEEAELPMSGDFEAYPDGTKLKVKPGELTGKKSANGNLCLEGYWVVTGIPTALQDGTSYTRRIWDNGSLLILPKTAKELTGQPEVAIKNNNKRKGMWQERIAALGLSLDEAVPSDLTPEAMTELGAKICAAAGEALMTVELNAAGDTYTDRDGQVQTRQTSKNRPRGLYALTEKNAAQFEPATQMETPF